MPVEVTFAAINLEVEIVEANIVAPKVPSAASDSAEIGDRQAADAQIDVVGAGAKSRCVQEEVIWWMNIVPVVEALTRPRR